MLLEKLDWPLGYSLHDGGVTENSVLFYRMAVLMDRMEVGYLNRVLALCCALSFVVQLRGPAWSRNL